jgi:tRNA (guanosine-2'-O-)-methyltransferase
MKQPTIHERIAYLARFVTAERWQKLQHMVNQRTDYVTVVLEDVYQAHNISAALRSAECFGLQTVHIMEHRHPYRVEQHVAKGAGDWLHVQRTREDTLIYLEKLKKAGYSIVATSPRPGSYQLTDLPLDNKIALLFGTEETGLTRDAFASADATVAIPMYGFTESFNISVSVAICLYEITRRLRVSDFPWQLTDDQKQEVLLSWLRSSVRGAEHLEKLLLTQDGQPRSEE